MTSLANLPVPATRSDESERDPPPIPGGHQHFADLPGRRLDYLHLKVHQERRHQHLRLTVFGGALHLHCRTGGITSTVVLCPLTSELPSMLRALIGQDDSIVFALLCDLIPLIHQRQFDGRMAARELVKRALLDGRLTMQAGNDGAARAVIRPAAIHRGERPLTESSCVWRNGALELRVCNRLALYLCAGGEGASAFTRVSSMGLRALADLGRLPDWMQSLWLGELHGSLRAASEDHARAETDRLLKLWLGGQLVVEQVGASRGMREIGGTAVA